MPNLNKHTFGTIIILWPLVATTTTVYCHPIFNEKIITTIAPTNISVMSTKSKQMKNEAKERNNIEMPIAITGINNSANYNNLTIFGNNSFEDEDTNDALALYGSRDISNEIDNMTATILVVISGIAIITAFCFAMASIIYRRRKKLCVSSKVYHQAKSSFFATETEFHPWDGLSFTCTAADFQKSKVQFCSLESLSDDSFITGLDEAISRKASVVQKSLQDTSVKPTNNKAISELIVSVNDCGN